MTNQPPISDFQLECFRAANDRLLFRVKRRENWLKIQLLLQVALFALENIWKGNSTNLTLHVSLPLSFILCSLYVSEDRLAGHIVSYLNALGKTLAAQSETGWPNLESSPEGRDYVKTALPVRLLAQLFGFLLLPLGISGLGFLSLTERQSGDIAEMIAWLFLSALIAWLLFNTYRSRRQ